MENEVYQIDIRDNYNYKITKTTDRRAKNELNTREEIEFSPAYEELKQNFNSNPFSARSCKCNPSRC